MHGLPMLVRKGTQVLLCDLPEWPPMNGRRGVVSRDVAEDDGRVQVSLVGGVRYIFPRNLRSSKAVGPGDTVTLVGFPATKGLNGQRGVVHCHAARRDALVVLVHGQKLEVLLHHVIGSRRPQQVLPAARHPQLPAGGLYRDQQAQEDAALAAILAGRTLGRSFGSQAERDADALSSFMRGEGNPTATMQMKEDQALAALLGDVHPATEVTAIPGEATVFGATQVQVPIASGQRHQEQQDAAALQNILQGGAITGSASERKDDAAIAGLLGGNVDPATSRGAPEVRKDDAAMAGLLGGKTPAPIARSPAEQRDDTAVVGMLAGPAAGPGALGSTAVAAPSRKDDAAMAGLLTGIGGQAKKEDDSAMAGLLGGGQSKTKDDLAMATLLGPPK
mmetsp:Transcript_68373/g.164091  ORF Transcript_68373/g.164091 Transcript_68373/m.164091 type:complete len:391 (+) Transcript_68373:39-1211(+)